MDEQCREFEDLLVAVSLHDLPESQRQSLDRHLGACDQCRALSLAHTEDDAALERLVISDARVLEDLELRIREQVGIPPASERSLADGPRRPVRSRILRWVAATAVLSCVMLSWAILDRESGEGLLWADVLAQVSEAEDYICRRIEQRRGENPLDMIEYRSARFGLRQDIHQDGRLMASQYIVPAESCLYALVHRDRTWMRQALTAEQIQEMRRQSSASHIVRSFRENVFRSLGRKRIDGRMAEGIEIDDPEEWTSAFERIKLRLWVDLESQWPVRIEVEGTAGGGDVRKDYVLEDFEWNAELRASHFAVEIPDGYRMIADLGQVEATEQGAIEGLRSYAELMDGRYPSELVLATAIAEAEEMLDREHSRYDEAAGRDLTALFRIRNSCDFLRDLRNADSDPAYRGGEVTRFDFDRVLLRWRLEDGRYRVIFGDLRASTVDELRLRELEIPR